MRSQTQTMTNPQIMKVPDTPVVWTVIGQHLYQAYFDGHLHQARFRGRQPAVKMVPLDRNRMTIWTRWIKYYRKLYIAFFFFRILSPFVKPYKIEKICRGAARNK